MEEPQDHELIRAAASGSREALGALYDRYFRVSFLVSLRILKNEREAEDVVHDAFLEIWKRSATYDSTRASVKGWILLIVRSRSLDRKKSSAFRPTTSVDEVDIAACHEFPDADAPRVLSILSSLPSPQREVIELGYFEGLSSSEIAERLGVPIGTVKSRVAAALGRLRTELGVA